MMVFVQHVVKINLKTYYYLFIMKNKVLMSENDIDIIKDHVMEKYNKDLVSYEKALSSIDKIYDIIYKIVIFNKKNSKNLSDDEFVYIYDLNCKLECLEEDFENHIYNPNYSTNLNTRDKVYTYRKNMVDEIKNNLTIIINNFSI